MPVSPSKDFELSNCSDYQCTICHPKGYPSKLELNDYHKQQLAKSFAILVTWIANADLSNTNLRA